MLNLNNTNQPKMSYFGGKQVVWIGKNNEILNHNTIYTIDNFIDCSDVRVKLSDKKIIFGRLLIQVKLKNGQKSEYLPFSSFRNVD